LQAGAYSQPDEWRSLMVDSPSTQMYSGPPSGEDPTQIVQAWRLFVQSMNELPNKYGPYYYDLVDLTRQILSNEFYELYQMFQAGFARYVYGGGNEAAELTALGNMMLKLINSTDALLATNVNYLLGRWINDAKRWGFNDTTNEKLVVFNAKNQVTLWGPDGQITDYAAKAWAGLFSTYYYNRWQLFISFVLDAVNQDRIFNYSKYNELLFAFEWEWNNDFNATFNYNPVGVTETEVLNIYNAYGGKMSDNYVLFQGYDAPGNDLIQTWTKDIAQIAFLCDTDPLCQGFNSNGWIKFNVNNRVPSSANLYVKKQALFF